MHRIVFVLQQSDLASKAELDTNLERVRSYARERGVSDPKIFPVSALREQQGAQDSGFAEFRAYLRSSVESGDVWQIKFDGACNVLKQVTESIRSDLNEAKSLITDDLQFLRNLEETLTQRNTKLEGLQQLIMTDLLGTYVQITDTLRQTFESGLEVGTILRRSLPIVRDTTIKDWVQKLNEDFKIKSAEAIEKAASSCYKLIEVEIISMMETTKEKLKSQSEKSVLKLQTFFDERKEIFDALLGALNKDRLGEHLQNVIRKDSPPELNLAGGSGLAIIGAAVTLFTKIAIFEVTGGILTAVGALLITVTLVWKRGVVMKEFNQKISEGKKSFEHQVSREISSLINKLFHEIGHKITENRDKLEKAKEDREIDFFEADAILNELRKVSGV